MDTSTDPIGTGTIPDGWATANLRPVLAEIEQYDLLPHLAELELYGLTVIPPAKVGPPELIDRLVERVTEVATEQNNGIAPDFATGATHSELASPPTQLQLLRCLAAEGEVFEDAILNPVVLTMARAVIGSDPCLFTARSLIKGPDRMPLFLHADQPVQPTPTAYLCNTTYVLTDYTRENGCLCFVPGSHRLMRYPTASENFSFGGLTPAEVAERTQAGEEVKVEDPPNLVAVEAPKGSLIVWHGNTWHGAFNRTAPGLRASLILVFAHRIIRPQEPYPHVVPDEVFDRHDSSFARLLGRGVSLG